MEKKIGILTISTRKYNQFIVPLYNSIVQNFLPKHKIGLLLFTDTPYCQHHDFKKNVWSESNKDRVFFSGFKVEHRPWPYMTLFRYHIFNKHKNALKNFDYLYYLDADMLVESTISESIFPDTPEQIVAVQHPGFYRGGGSWEDNTASMAYVPFERRGIYWAGGFNGGSAEAYLTMCTHISEMLALDQLVNVTPVWHDESYLNRYLLDKDVKTLHSGYIYPEGWTIPFTKKITALKKNHELMRKEEY